MKSLELKEFFAADRREYCLSQNKEFMIWLYDKLQAGYRPYLDLLGLQNLILTIIGWYEIKYPNHLFEIEHGAADYRFEGFKYVISEADINQLRFMLSRNQLETIDCNYRGHIGYIKKEDGKYHEYVGVELIKESNNQKFYVNVSAKEGVVDNVGDLAKKFGLDFDLKRIFFVEDLHTILQKQGDLNIKGIEEMLFIKQTDLALRDLILQYVILGLIYSRNSNPEYGLKRATYFSEEFARYYGIEIKVPRIEELMSIDKADYTFKDEVELQRLRAKITNKLAEIRI